MYIPVMWFVFIMFAQLMEGGSTQVHKLKQEIRNFNLAVILEKKHQLCEKKNWFEKIETISVFRFIHFFIHFSLFTPFVFTVKA